MIRARPLPVLAVLFTVLVSMAFSGSSFPESSTSLWQARTVHAMRVSMAVDVILDPASTDPKHESRFDHRVRVIIVDDATGRTLDVETVELDVAQLGYSGSRVTLAPKVHEGKPVFQGQISMNRGRPYRMLVHFRLAGSPITHEAHYEYRHHF